MKRFLIKILSYFLLLSALWVLIVGSIYYKINYNSSFYKINNSINKIILGDSHVETSINDKILKNSLNISTSADNYYYSWLKLKKLIKHNKQIDTLILSYSFHNLSKKMEERWLYNPQHFANRYPKTFYLIEREDFFELFIFLKKMPFTFLSENMILPKIILKKSFVNNVLKMNIGGFVFWKKNNIEHLNKQVVFAIKSQGIRNFKVSEKEKEYLLKIVSFCKNNKVEMILVNTPIHPKLYSAYPPKVTKLYYNFYHKYLKDYKLLDYSQFKLDNSCFKDCSHLNGKGSDLFTKELVNRLYEKY